MAYCHECGSEIAELEAFCPYCGISLQPVSVPEKETKEDKPEFIHEIIEEDSDNQSSETVDTSAEIDSSSADEINDDFSMSETVVVPLEKDELESIETDDSVSEIEEENVSAQPENIESEIEKNEVISISEEEIVEEENELSKHSILEDDTTVSEKSVEIDSDKKGEPVLTSDTDSIENEVSDNIDLILSDKEETSAEMPEPIIEEERVFKVDAELSSQSESNDNISMSVEESDSSSSTIDEPQESFVETTPDTTETEVEEIDTTENIEIEEQTEIEQENLVEEKNESDGKEFADSEIAQDDDFAATIPYVAIEENKPEINSDDAQIEEVSSVKEEVAQFTPDIAEEQPEPDDLSDVSLEMDDARSEKDKEVVENVVEVQKANSEAVKTTAEVEDEISQQVPEEQQDIEDSEAQTIVKGSSKLESVSEDTTESTDVEEEKVVSSTTPNIGTTDTDGNKSSKLKPLSEGTVLNARYEIVRKIGGGGMGAVYLASDKNLGGVLRAVKEMVQSYIEEEQQEKAIQDFKRESMLLTSLEHSSIPTIYDYFFDEKEARFYLVMKYISGGDLAARLKAAPEGRLDEKSVVEWGIQIADVLSYLHNRQPPIVYRDLKPANVMMDGNSGRIMLIDFGIARWINKEEKGVTAVGTMGYAPPELFSGNVEPRSDVYSLGSTMFHLLTGADPQSNPLLIFDFQKHPRPRQINPSLSDQVERIVMRAVEYNAEKRFETATQMRDALIKHLEQLSSGQVSFGVKQTPQPIGLEEQPVFCGFCGQKIVASDMFCAFCGAKQPLAQPGVHSKEYVQTKVTAKLMIDGTSELDVPAFILEKTENLVGRRDPLSNIFPEVDLSKYDPQTKISRKHARIWRDGDNFLIEDLGSSNGTVVMQAMKEAIRLEPKRAIALANGDKIKLGDTTLQFVIQ